MHSTSVTLHISTLNFPPVVSLHDSVRDVFEVHSSLHSAGCCLPIVRFMILCILLTNRPSIVETTASVFKQSKTPPCRFCFPMKKCETVLFHQLPRSVSFHPDIPRCVTFTEFIILCILQAVLGERLKYSSALYEENETSPPSLSDAEEAMLRVTCEVLHRTLCCV